MTARLVRALTLFATTAVLHAEPPQEAAFKYLSPQEAIEKMKYPEGFVVNAFAAEPNCQQPFAFTFDERGRVWMCENLNYETRGSDLYKLGPLGRIVILTDTDGDGTMDERKVFKDKIMFPTGIALGHGGVYVGSPPNLLYIPDKNRDDVPDGDPVVKLDGFGRQDRHETLNSFLWGPDGWLYGCHGVFTHSKVGKPGAPDNERVPLNAGVWRYHPINEKFEVFAWGTSNPWGLDFNDRGQAFVTACVIPHLFHMIQGGRYHRQGGKHFNRYVYEDIKTIADHRHASAHGGARFYLADQFPEKYRGRLFMCNIHLHGVLTDILERKGTGYSAKHGEEFCMSNDPQWLGFNMELGPDGSVYAIDWHDSDICGRKVLHRKTGRLWRISYGEVKFPVGMDLTRLPDAKLVEMHLHKNEWYARQARRLLQERALAGRILPATLAGLRRILAQDKSVSHRLRALWTLQLVGGLGDVMLAPLLDDKEEYIRAWAIQLMAEDGRVPEAVLEKWASMAKSDGSAVVRLYLASAMQRVEPAQRWGVLEALVAQEEDKDDHNQPLLIWYALEPLVVLNDEKTAKIVAACKIDKLKGFIDRRGKAGGKRAAAVVPQEPEGIKAKPARSVPAEGLVLHLKAEEKRPELFAHYRELLTPRNLKAADVRHGRAVYGKSCGQCHSLFGEGGTAGPNLSGKDLRDLDYLLPHVLDPDGEIGEKYRYEKFELKDERVVLGIVAEESKESFTLESLVGRFDLSKAQVAHRDVLPYSMMPDAVFQTLTDEEVRDLVAYLQGDGAVAKK